MNPLKRLWNWIDGWTWLCLAVLALGVVGCFAPQDGREREAKKQLNWTCVNGIAYLAADVIGPPIFDADGKPMPCAKWRALQPNPQR